jgi:hypothetical protein
LPRVGPHDGARPAPSLRGGPADDHAPMSYT